MKWFIICGIVVVIGYLLCAGTIASFVYAIGSAMSQGLSPVM
jgi:uncharacterized MAPEG superfamily protein